MKKSDCAGCYNDVYNGKPVDDGRGGTQVLAKECWSFKTAKIVTRWRIGTWTMPATPGAFTEVRVPSCYHRNGVSYYKELPDFAVSPNKMKRTADTLAAVAIIALALLAASNAHALSDAPQPPPWWDVIGWIIYRR